MGDVHGNAKGLKQCIERSGIDKENDILISLGDIADGYAHVYECVEELLTFKNLIAIRGNHDDWFQKWMDSGIHPDQWTQGGKATYMSYIKEVDIETLKDRPTGNWGAYLQVTDIPMSHWKFFHHQNNYYIDDNNRLFVHGGFNRHLPFKGQQPWIYYWDRDLWAEALSFHSMTKKHLGEKVLKFKLKDDFSEIFIGHTGTEFWGETVPMHAAMIWNVDTGGGNSTGKVTIMDVDTKEFWQSDQGIKLYPDERGR